MRNTGLAQPSNKAGFEYYNQKQDIQFKEYGRNVENLVRYIVKQEDREVRSRLCNTLLGMVRKLHPNLIHDNQEDYQKFWDHMHLISGLQLDVDSPFPIPEIEMLERKPERIPYPQKRVKVRFYGENIELLIAQAVAIEDEEERKRAIVYIGRLMKTFYVTYNKDSAEDSLIIKQMELLSDGKLTIDLEEVRANGLFDGVAGLANWRPQAMEEVGARKKKKPQQHFNRHKRKHR